MPKTGDMYPSRWLTAKDCEDEDMILTIKGLHQEEIGQGADRETKWIVDFEETEKGLVINKTNTNTIASIHGDDTDNWEGKKVALFATEVDFQGRATMAIRVRLRAPKAKSKAAAPSPVATNGDDDEADPNIPF